MIRTRRSVRRYKDEPIPKEHLQTIVDAGRLAASGCNHQPWHFVVVTDKAMIGNFRAVNTWIVEASAVIVVVMDPKSRWWVEDGAAAIQNMMLASKALGYGSCWVEGDILEFEEHVKSLMGVPAHLRAMALVPIGVPAETPHPKKKPLKAVLHWEKF